jgi:hypothetical protein
MHCMRDNRSTGLRLLLWSLPGAHSSFPPHLCAREQRSVLGPRLQDGGKAQVRQLHGEVVRMTVFRGGALARGHHTCKWVNRPRSASWWEDGDWEEERTEVRGPSRQRVQGSSGPAAAGGSCLNTTAPAV